VSRYPKEFLPDLRRVRRWRGLTDSLWRNPDLVRLTYGELAELVHTCIGSQACRILYVGPGLGHIALELARAGHDVIGVEVDEASVALATRAAETDPFAMSGALSRIRSPSSRVDSLAKGHSTVCFSPASCTT
jgi:2-polyprenyl-3-methyl-5-hydroxy-6-metoxy-1,4-benzoquinol methylase